LKSRSERDLAEEELVRLRPIFIEYFILESIAKGGDNQTEELTETEEDVSNEVSNDVATEEANEVSNEVAKALAEQQYEKFRPLQDQNYESDFDKEINKKGLKNK
jgi:hypothetical protein